MVVPWIGVPLHKVLKKALPLSNARFVKFTSVLRPKEMIGQRRPTLAWPYTEALRIDEAMHPLTLLVTGMYGDTLPAQNGAPLRLMVPWKYGFKHIKAIQSIKLVEQQPIGSWQSMAPKEYGFYAMNSLRLEKSFGIWNAEFMQDRTPGMTGMDRWIAWDKGDFNGREAALKEKESASASLKLVTLEVDADNADASGYEPIWKDGQRIC